MSGGKQGDRGVRRSLPGASVDEAYAEGDPVLRALQRTGGTIQLTGPRAKLACALVAAGKLEVLSVTVSKPRVATPVIPAPAPSATEEE